MKKRILIVEDDLSTRMLLNHVLGQHFQLTTLANGKEALDWLNEGNVVDLLLTDIDMPQLSGIDLIYRIELYPFFKQLPIVVLSGQDSNQLDKLRASNSVYGVVSKPFHYKTLLWTIEDALSFQEAV